MLMFSSPLELWPSLEGWGWTCLWATRSSPPLCSEYSVLYWMNIFLNEYSGFCFELNHFSARFNETMNFQNVSNTPRSYPSQTRTSLVPTPSDNFLRIELPNISTTLIDTWHFQANVAHHPPYHWQVRRVEWLRKSSPSLSKFSVNNLTDVGEAILWSDQIKT